MSAAAEPPRSGVIGIVSTAGVPAYRRAVDGLQRTLARRGNVPAVVFELAPDAEPSAFAAVLSIQPQLIVSVGSRAAAVAGTGIPVISTMVLEDEADSAAGFNRALSRLTLDISPKTVFTRVRELFPLWRRIAVIRASTQVEPSPQDIQQQAAALGFSAEIIDCKGAGDVLEALTKRRGRADAVWCLPNRALYHPASVNAIILSSIRYRLPLIGFSESFVSAGALVGFLPDYADIGGQTAEMVERYREGQSLRAKENPRRVRTVINQRVLRTLGMEVPEGIGAEFVN
jgi:ABC-type uncharacterized transport system substrate-binding protein